jgi:hypothetical protein
VAQPKRGFGGAAEKPPHPATVSVKAPPHPATIAQRCTAPFRGAGAIQRTALEKSKGPTLSDLGILDDEQVKRWEYFLRKKKAPAENKVRGLIAEYVTKYFLQQKYTPDQYVVLTGVKVSIPGDSWEDLAEIDVLVGTVDEAGRLIPVAIAEAKAGKYGPGKYAEALTKKLKAIEMLRSNRALLTMDYPIATILEEDKEVTVEALHQRTLVAYKKNFGGKVAGYAAGPEGKDVPIQKDLIEMLYAQFKKWWSATNM